MTHKVRPAFNSRDGQICLECGEKVQTFYARNGRIVYRHQGEAFDPKQTSKVRYNTRIGR